MQKIIKKPFQEFKTDNKIIYKLEQTFLSPISKQEREGLCKNTSRSFQERYGSIVTYGGQKALLITAAFKIIHLQVKWMHFYVMP